MSNIQKPTRQIKFRAWDCDNKRFYKPTYEADKGNLEDLNIAMNGALFIRTINEWRHESLFPDRFILQQFTGLQDKKGKDIYEGDKLSNGIDTYEVFWDSEYAQFVWSKNHIEDFSDECKYFEIIGNIYEK